MATGRVLNRLYKPAAVTAAGTWAYKSMQPQGVLPPSNFNLNMLASGVSTASVTLSAFELVDSLVLLAKHKEMNPAVRNVLALGALLSLATLVYGGISFGDAHQTGKVVIFTAANTLFNAVTKAWAGAQTGVEQEKLQFRKEYTSIA